MSTLVSFTVSFTLHALEMFLLVLLGCRVDYLQMKLRKLESK